MKAPLPADEDARLENLRQYGILDSQPEKAFDDIVLLASRICGTPMAMVTLVDQERQWFKAKIGTTASETHRDLAICAHGILQAEVLVVPDTMADARFSDNPLVREGSKIRFYAGAPLRSAEGHALGMICVIDQRPRNLTKEQTEALEALGRQVVMQFELRRSLTEQKQMVTELRQTKESLQLLSSAINQTKESIVITDAILDSPGPRIVFTNPAFTRMTGYTFKEVFGKTPRILQGPLTDKNVLSKLRRNLEDGQLFEGETINYRKNGEEFNLEWQIAPIRSPDGITTHYVAVQHDITERKKLEGRLFQSQKMETVGKLAGGVAHEFNSILTAIIGQSELLLGDLPPKDSLRKNVMEIHQAAERAAKLTRQLLAYGRKQMLQPETIDLGLLLEELKGTLQHVMGSEIEIQITSSDGPKLVTIDRGQIEQVVMNMAMNAVHAMSKGGRFTLELANATVNDDDAVAMADLKPGNYIILGVTDSGIGMTTEIKSRMFEPFFSTKGVGYGTGLGLATCFGIIKQSRGHISVYSEPSRGTSFKIYLPEADQIPVRPEVPSKSALPGGTETILLAEDDPSLLDMAANLLRRLGYTVLTASDGIEALKVKQQKDVGHIDLLLTDIVMPHMSGKELSERIRVIYPKTKVLFTSAFTDNSLIHQGILNGSLHLLPKPFNPNTLAKMVREVLDLP